MNDELIAQAEIGDEAKRFLESDFGRCVMGIAEQEAQAATEKYKTADPEDAKAIRQIQYEVWRAESFKEWVTELVIRGEQAIAIFKQQRDS